MIGAAPPPDQRPAPLRAALDSAAKADFSWPRWWRQAGRFAVCFAVMPNLPLWLFAKGQGLVTPGWISLDGLLLGLLALFIRPGWALLVFVPDLLLDIVYCIRATYGPSYADTLMSVRYLFTAVARGQLLEITALFALSIAVIGVVWIKFRPRLRGRERWGLVAIVFAVLIPWSVMARQARTGARAERELNARLGFARDASAPSYSDAWASSARSPALAFYHAWNREHLWKALRGELVQPLAPAPSATSHALPWLTPPRNLVVVLVESWGEAQNPALRQALLEPFTALMESAWRGPEQSGPPLPAIEARHQAANGSDPAKRGEPQSYRVETGTTPFHGPTGDGELRELCNLRFDGPGITAAVAPASLADCLGWQLARRGYQTTAMDSAAKFWPGGENWYRIMGFQHIIDYNALHARGLPEFTGGTFRSIPDADEAALLPELLNSGTGPHFIFFLTISAHLPIHLPVPAGFTADCGMAPVTRSSPAACGWFKVESATLAAIARAAAAPDLPPTVFVVVGDHRPPFVSSALDAFSPDVVPYVLLAPTTSR